MDKISNNTNKNDLNNLLDVLKIIWGKKYFIASVTTLFAIFSVNYATNLPNIYTYQLYYQFHFLIKQKIR